MTAAKPRAVLVDVDGTLALRGDRSPYDWSRVGEDLPNEPVIELVRVLDRAGYQSVVMSGRDEVCRWQTEMWLRAQGIHFDVLLMRPAGDNRRDDVVKAELYDRYVDALFDVAFVIDDREQVVRMWRERGLTVFQCAEGRF